MTSWIHMHLTKASDVPLNYFNEYWGVVEQERENKIDSGFKKEEAFFLCSLMLSVWQWLSFVRNNVVLCSNSYMTTMRRNTSIVVLMMDLRNSSASDSGRPNTFQIHNRLAETLRHHFLTCTLFCVPTVETSSDNHSPKQALLCLPNALWGLPGFFRYKMVFCACFEWTLYSSITKSSKYKKRPFH